MKARPILFSASMIHALLGDRKVQTRRVIRPQPRIDEQGNFCWRGVRDGQSAAGDSHAQKLALASCCDSQDRGQCPYGKPGDLLWVKETWGIDRVGGRVPLNAVVATNGGGFPVAKVKYAADDGSTVMADEKRSSLFMPRWASRLTLQITDVRVERLQEISEADAVAEGVFTPGAGYAENGPPVAVVNYGALWESINGAGSWDENPWVWALTFKVHKENVDALRSTCRNESGT